MSLARRDFLAALAAAALVLPQAARAQEPARPRPAEPEGEMDHIAMLLYPGMTALDFVGPYHFLAGMGGVRVHLVTNQNNLNPVQSDLGMAIQPTVTMKECPSDLTLIFVPGGTMGTVAAARDAATLDFVRDRASRARYVTSVCTGSLILGATGLLEGKKATSHWSVVDVLSRFGATPVRERVVRDGNVITGAGVSAGLDFGITLVEELRDRMTAEAGVLVSEYAPEPPITGGTLETARPEVAKLLTEALSPFVNEAMTLSVAG